VLILPFGDGARRLLTARTAQPAAGRAGRSAGRNPSRLRRRTSKAASDTTVVAIGARPVRRGAVLLDEHARGGARVYYRFCTCPEVYLSMPNVLGVHVVTVLAAVARVGDKRARIGMMTIFSCRVNGTVTSEWGLLH
jgi:hypothetical protein